MKFNPTSETARQEVLEYAKENLGIDEAKQILQNNGYFVANMWHISDVMEYYQCDEDTAQDVLYKTLTNEYVMQSVWDAIDYMAEDLNLERK
jgi:hypothetical protein